MRPTAAATTARAVRRGCVGVFYYLDLCHRTAYLGRGLGGPLAHRGRPLRSSVRGPDVRLHLEYRIALVIATAAANRSPGVIETPPSYTT